MKIQEINEEYKLFGRFRVTLAKNNLYHFDSIEEFKSNNQKMKDCNQFILRDLTIKRKTEENTSYVTHGLSRHVVESLKYQLLLEDKTGNFSAEIRRSSRMIFSPDHETWEGVVNARDGDVIDGLFIYDPRDTPWISELENKTIDSKV